MRNTLIILVTSIHAVLFFEEQGLFVRDRFFWLLSGVGERPL
jgi:hypothetical protein